MSANADFPQVETSLVVIERSGMVLAEYNPKWELFTLPIARRRRRLAPGNAALESPQDAAVRAASKALGRPLAANQVPRPISLDVPPHLFVQSGRDQHTKRYTCHVFGLRVADPAPRHAAGWHTVWLRPEDFLTHRPISPTAVFVLRHLPDGLLAI